MNLKFPESFVFEQMAKRAGMSVDEWLVQLGKKEVENLYASDLPAYNRILAELGRRVLDGQLGVVASEAGAADRNNAPSNRRTCEKCGKTKGVQAFLKGQEICRKCSGKSQTGRNVVAQIPMVRTEDEVADAQGGEPEEIPGKPGMFRCARCATAKLRNAFPKRGSPDADVCYQCQKEEMAV